MVNNRKPSFGWFLFFGLVFLVSLSSAAEVLDELHLNIQTLDSEGGVITGSFDFDFNISTTADCNSVVYSKSDTLSTDSRGIISYYLEGVSLDYDEQYYLCYYRDGSLIESAKISQSPYAYRAKEIDLSGVSVDSNLDLSGYNLTADHLFGDGSMLTNLNVSELDLSDYYLQSVANSTFIFRSEENTLNVNSSTYWADLSGYVSRWFRKTGGQLDFNEELMNSTIDSKIAEEQSSLAVNSSQYWDNLDTPADILGSQINNDLSWVELSQLVSFVGNWSQDKVDYYLKTQVYNQSEVDTMITSGDVNSSDYWDNLDTPADIKGSQIDDDLDWVEMAEIVSLVGNWSQDKVDYYLKTQVYSKGETYNRTEVEDLIGLGEVNSSNYWDNLDSPADILGSQINNDLDWVELSQLVSLVGNWSQDKVDYYLKTQVYSKSEIEGFGYYNFSSFDIGDYYLASNPNNYLNETTLNVSSVNYWKKNGNDLYYSDGNVGVGTTSPGEKLSIYQSADNNGLAVYGYDDQNENKVQINLDASGIGQIIGPDAGLRLKDNGNNVAFINDDGANGFRLYNDIPVSFGTTAATRFSLGYDSSEDKLRLSYGGGITDDSKIKLVVDNVGNMGIGTTVPQEKLHVAGNAVINGTVNTDGNRVVNIANGTAAQDAVSYSQLQAVNSQLSGNISDNYVPYTGANQNVDLGGNDLSTTGAVTVGTINTGSGAMKLGDAAVANSDTNSIPTSDQVYDFVDGNYYLKSNQNNYINSSNLAAAESDPHWTGNYSSRTGTGNVVYSNSPSLTTPNIGAATAGGNLNMASNKITGLANGTAAQDAVSYSQLQELSGQVSGDYVPYTGATKNVDLGSYALRGNSIVADTSLEVGVDGVNGNRDVTVWAENGYEANIKLLETPTYGMGIRYNANSNYLSIDRYVNSATPTGSLFTFRDTGDIELDEGTIYVDSSEAKVGIGTDSPSEKLEVSGNVKVSQNLTINGMTIFKDTNGDMVFRA